MNVTLVFSIWAVVSIFAFRWASTQGAVLFVFLGGWLLLPVGDYPVGAAAAGFPYWIIGAALPSEIWASKAWVAPLCALWGVAWFDRPALLRFRLSGWDIPMIVWCCWPLLQWLLRLDVQPQMAFASAYLFGSWGVPWLLGRLYFGTLQGQAQLLTGLAWAALACIPIALFEGLFGPFLYGWLYEVHPFVSDGASRYLGWRPIGFFEHGNQYGLWVSACALACLWVWRIHAADRTGSRWKWACVAAWGAAVFAQSVGALLLLGLGSLTLQLLRYVRLQWLLTGTLCAGVLLGGVYLSGAVPLTHLGKDTAMGRKVVDTIRATGRGSFTWRIAQDQKSLQLVRQSLVLGKGQWDWWQSLGTRPWGLALLMVGQYGLIAFLLAFGALGVPAIRCLWHRSIGTSWNAVGAPAVLAVIVLITLADAGLNSFIFFPALLAAAALVPKAGDVTAALATVGDHIGRQKTRV